MLLAFNIFDWQLCFIISLLAIMTLALLMAIALVCVRKWQKSIAYVAWTVPETAGYRPWNCWTELQT